MIIIEKQSLIVLIVPNNKNPEIKIISNKLQTFRKIIGNEYIEVTKYKDVLIIYDAESVSKLLPINRTLDGINIRGKFIITGNDEKNQDFKDLSKEQIRTYSSELEIEKELEQGAELEDE